MREREVIPDIRLQRSDRHVARVRLSVRLDFVRAASHQLDGMVEVGDRVVESTYRDVSVPAMPIDARIRRKAANPTGEDVDGLVVTAQVRQPASNPDERVGIDSGAPRRPAGRPQAAVPSPPASPNPASAAARTRRAGRLLRPARPPAQPAAATPLDTRTRRATECRPSLANQRRNR